MRTIFAAALFVMASLLLALPAEAHHGIRRSNVQVNAAGPVDVRVGPLGGVRVRSVGFAPSAVVVPSGFSSFQSFQSFGALNSCGACSRVLVIP